MFSFFPIVETRACSSNCSVVNAILSLSAKFNMALLDIKHPPILPTDALFNFPRNGIKRTACLNPDRKCRSMADPSGVWHWFISFGAGWHIGHTIASSPTTCGALHEWLLQLILQWHGSRRQVIGAEGLQLCIASIDAVLSPYMSSFTWIPGHLRLVQCAQTKTQKLQAAMIRLSERYIYSCFVWSMSNLRHK